MLVVKHCINEHYMYEIIFTQKLLICIHLIFKVWAYTLCIYT